MIRLTVDGNVYELDGKLEEDPSSPDIQLELIRNLTANLSVAQDQVDAANEEREQARKAEQRAEDEKEHLLWERDELTDEISRLEEERMATSEALQGAAISVMGVAATFGEIYAGELLADGTPPSKMLGHIRSSVTAIQDGILEQEAQIEAALIAKDTGEKESSEIVDEMRKRAESEIRIAKSEINVIQRTTASKMERVKTLQKWYDTLVDHLNTLQGELFGDEAMTLQEIVPRALELVDDLKDTIDELEEEAQTTGMHMRRERLLVQMAYQDVETERRGIEDREADVRKGLQHVAKHFAKMYEHITGNPLSPGELLRNPERYAWHIQQSINALEKRKDGLKEITDELEDDINDIRKNLWEIKEEVMFHLPHPHEPAKHIARDIVIKHILNNYTFRARKKVTHFVLGTLAYMEGRHEESARLLEPFNPKAKKEWQDPVGMYLRGLALYNWDTSSKALALQRVYTQLIQKQVEHARSLDSLLLGAKELTREDIPHGELDTKRSADKLYIPFEEIQEGAYESAAVNYAMMFLLEPTHEHAAFDLGRCLDKIASTRKKHLVRNRLEEQALALYDFAEQVFERKDSPRKDEVIAQREAMKQRREEYHATG